MHNAQITTTSSAMIVNDHAGEYGTNRKLATALSDAKAIPTERAHSRAARTAKPAAMRSTPTRRWTEPQTVRSKGKRRSGVDEVDLLLEQGGEPLHDLEETHQHHGRGGEDDAAQDPTGGPASFGGVGRPRLARGIPACPLAVDIRPPAWTRPGGPHRVPVAGLRPHLPEVTPSGPAERASSSNARPRRRLSSTGSSTQFG
jgi:hypothetical protein